jgi:predicted ATPase/DNA-binding SARP family transcriptional activator
VTNFRVMGPIEAWCDERRITLGGPQQVKLLAFLLLRANRAVSADELIEAVWGAERDGAVKRLQMGVLRLRRALAPLDGHDGARLRTVSGGYLLSVGPGELDVEVFAERVREGRRALEDGDAARASGILTEALGLWRGPPLAEVAFEDFAQAEIRRLEELRLIALETRIDADLQQGRHAELIAELEALLTQQPTRERIAGQLMTALYRTGRQADALEVYQRTRARLAEELGLRPGPGLARIQAQVLSQDQALAQWGLSNRNKAVDEGGDRLRVLERPGPLPASFIQSNLPAPTSPLVGRAKELSLALELLAAPELRLLTFWGPGGSGKTRLALDVAAAARPRFRDGAWLVMLAPIPDRAVMVAELARVLDVVPAAGEPTEQALVRALAGRELLLVLDNFEHLLDAGGLVADLLAAAPQLAVLSTSREPLRIRGEQRLEVPPLPPDDAAELFLARARAARPDLEVDEDDRAAIERICERLDGLPLALELAAARAAVFGPRQLEARLTEGFELPEGARDLPERQRTLRATIDWSYQLLAPAERSLFSALSAFIGGVRIDTVESIWGAGAAEGLISLAEKSLLRRREDPDGALRFVMLETVMQFALERAAADGVGEEAADRHAEYFLAVAAQAAPYLHGPKQRRWLDRLECEHANLRAALDHLSAKEPSRATRMAVDLVWFLDIRGYRIEANDRLTRLLAAAPADDPGRGRALVAAGRLAHKMGDAAKAKALLLEALPIVRRQDDLGTTALALTFLGGAAGWLGDETAMVKCHEEAIATARAADDDWVLAVALNWYSNVSSVRRDPERARPMAEEALSLFRRFGDGAAICTTASTLGEIAVDAGDLETADKMLSEALDHSRELGYPPSIAHVLANRAVVSLLRDHVERAETDLKTAIQTGAAYADGVLAADVLSAAGTLAAMRREPNRAVMLWAAADIVLGSAREHKAVAGLRARWQSAARAELGDQAACDDAILAGAQLTLKDALALAARPSTASLLPRDTVVPTA